MAVDKNMKILVVDDYATMLRIISNILGQLGFNNVETAQDGGEAFQKLKDTDVHFIISDWNMVPVTGLELLKKVRADESTKGIPFIMVTAESKSENVIVAKEAGVSNYIVKPFNSETLKGKMESVLGPF